MVIWQEAIYYDIHDCLSIFRLFGHKFDSDSCLSVFF